MGARRASKPDHKSIGNRVERALLAVAQMVAFSPHQVRELHAAVVGDPPPRYQPLRLSNPAHLHAAVEDPELREASERFHGTPEETAVLDDDQRPPREVVVLGKLEGIAYRPNRRSKRGGIVWEHEAGDRGDGEPRNRGRGLVVSDGERVFAVPGNSGPEFDPDRGIVG